MASNLEKAARNATPVLGGDTVYPSLIDEKYHDLACAILEQAVLDWKSLDCGKLGYCLGSNSHAFLYRAEVESFFQGKLFGFLLEYALPGYSPSFIRKALHIEERSQVCENS